MKEYSRFSSETLGLSIKNLDFTDRTIQFSHLHQITQLKLSNLKHLNLSNNDVGDPGTSVLSLANWPVLENLYLKNTKITSKGIQKIVDQSNWPQLKHLDVSSNQIDHDGLVSLSLAAWPLLERLNLTQIDTTNIKSFIPVLALNYPSLKEIIFSETDILYINSMLSNYCSNLQILDLSKKKLTPQKLEKILGMSQFPQLEVLNLSDNDLSDEGVSALALGHWLKLEELHLKNTKISSKALQTIVYKLNLLGLQKLDISHNPIDDQALQLLALANWSRFQYLTYYETNVTLDGVLIFLANLIHWPNLKQLEFSFCKLLSNYRQNILHGIAPIQSSNKKRLFMFVLRVKSVKSKDLSLSIKDQTFQRKIKPVSLEEWNEQESLSLDPPIKSNKQYSQDIDPLLLKFTTLPLDLKTLSYTHSRPNEKDLIPIFSNICPLLEELSINNLEIGTKALEFIFAKSDWPNLRKLHVAFNPIRDAGLEILISQKWPLLEDLNLAGTEIKTKGIEFLVANSNWPNLKKLNLFANGLQQEGIQMLISAKWPLLEDLNLSATTISFDKFQQKKDYQLLFNQSHWPKLKILDLSQNSIGIAGLEILASAGWDHLEELNISSMKITSKTLKVLLQKSSWPNLKKLDICDNEIADEGLITLASVNWLLLEDLNLHKTNTSELGIEFIVCNSNWLNLKKLNLSNNPIQDKALEMLASAKRRSLKDLDLQSTNITAQGLKFLEKAQWFTLEKLSIPSNLEAIISD